VAYEGAGSGSPREWLCGALEWLCVEPQRMAVWSPREWLCVEPQRMAMDEPKATALDLRGDQGGVRRGREREPQRMAVWSP
jgi:hypothetical protein